MPEVVSCPNCQAMLNVSDELFGQQARCPKCQMVFEPTPTETEPPPETYAPSPPAAPPLPQSLPVEVGEEFDPRPRRRRRRMHYDDYDYDVPYWATRREPELAGRATGAIICLVLLLATDILGMLAHLNLLNFLNRPNHFGRFAEARRIDTFIDLVAGVQTTVTILAAIFFCMWIYRAYENLRVFRMRGLGHSPGMAAGSFFIPIVNFVLPCLIAQEIFRASNPHGSPNNWKRGGGSAIVAFWWAFWMISIAIGLVASIIGANAGLDPFPSVDALRNATILTMISGVFSFIAAIFAILVVRTVTARQEMKFRRIYERDDFNHREEY